jgi:hypothetical protein
MVMRERCMNAVPQCYVLFLLMPGLYTHYTVPSRHPSFPAYKGMYSSIRIMAFAINGYNNDQLDVTSINS